MANICKNASAYVNTLFRFLYGKALTPEERVRKALHGFRQIKPFDNIYTADQADRMAEMFGRIRDISSPQDTSWVDRARRIYGPDAARERNKATWLDHWAIKRHGLFR